MLKSTPIGALADQTGVKVPTIGYYKSVRLLHEPDRTESNRRTYGSEAVRRLRFIRHAREVDASRQFLGIADELNRSCNEADAIARAHVADIYHKIARLAALRSEVQNMVDQCAQGRIHQCRVIEVLAAYDECGTKSIK